MWVWNHTVIPEVIQNAPAAVVRGQGLTSTKWKGCRIINTGMVFIILFTKLSIWKIDVLFILELLSISFR